MITASLKASVTVCFPEISKRNRCFSINVPPVLRKENLSLLSILGQL